MHWLVAVTFLLFATLSAAFADPGIPSKYKSIPKNIPMDAPVYGEFERTFSVKDVMRGPSPTLIGGVVATPGEFPATPWIGNCTGALAGERVLVTAAHCVSNGGMKSFTVASTKYTAKCSHHPEYRNNATADVALCLTDKKVQGVPFEKIATTIDYAKSTLILLSGYGCQKWSGGLDGRLRIGKAPVTRLPSGKDYDTVTTGSSALCSGDSGGPAFLVAPDGERTLVGVNSRSNTTTVSYLSSHGVESMQDFYNAWASSNSVRLCGVHADAVGCRTQRPQEPVEIVVQSSSGEKTIKYEITVLPGSPSTVEHSRKSFQDAADYLTGKK